MKKIVICLWGMLLFLHNASATQLEDVIEIVQPSVFSVAVDIDNATQSVGAGVLIDSSGYIVTNAHVIQNAEVVNVFSFDEMEYPADVVGKDDLTDIALLKLRDDISVEPAKFGNSDDIRVGNRVFVIGNPFGLGNSVSTGIISAKERNIDKGLYDNFIQTDATINQGNSGGPLFNMNGEVIGISTAIFSENGNSSGIGFATPSNLVEWVVMQLKEYGTVKRGWLGMSVKRIKHKSQQDEFALVVSALDENSPALNAGVQVGDVIVALGEVPVSNPRLFSLEVSKLKSQTSIPIVVKRGEKELDYQLVVGEKGNKTTKKQGEKLLSFDELGIDKNKIQYAKEIKKIDIKAYFDENTRELVVVYIKKGAGILDKGVKLGSRINKINGQEIYGLEDFIVKLKEISEKNKVRLSIKDNNELFDIMIDMANNDDKD